MADDADRASETEQVQLRAAIARREPVQPHTGFCFNCEEPCDGAYCDKDCRDDFERRNRRI